MNAKERYKLFSHLERLMLWQLAQLEAMIREEKRERRERIRRLREANRRVKLGIPTVIKANVDYYSRTINRGH